MHGELKKSSQCWIVGREEVSRSPDSSRVSRCLMQAQGLRRTQILLSLRGKASPGKRPSFHFPIFPRFRFLENENTVLRPPVSTLLTSRSKDYFLLGNSHSFPVSVTFMNSSLRLKKLYQKNHSLSPWQSNGGKKKKTFGWTPTVFSSFFVSCSPCCPWTVCFLAGHGTSDPSAPYLHPGSKFWDQKHVPPGLTDFYLSFFSFF